MSKGPFRNLTIAQVESVERQAYVIQVGGDFFSDKGKFAFNKKTATRHYNKIVRNLSLMMITGTKKQKKLANFCFQNLRLSNIRIH